MTRLAVPIVMLLLMLFAGAVGLLAVYFDLPQMAAEPSPPAAVAGKRAPPGEQPSAPPPQAEAPQAQAPQAQASQAEAPPSGTSQGASFDVARIDPQGTSVFAGRAEPGSTVTILGDGKPIGTTEADEDGAWTFATEHPFASADPKLALTVKSAAETGAEKEKARQPQVAGSLQTAVPAQDKPAHKTAGTIASDLLKDFEGIVAAARSEAEQKKGQTAQGNSAETKPETGGEAATQQTEAAEEPPAKTEASSTPAPAPADHKQEKKQDNKVALADPPVADPSPAATADAPETTTAPSQQSAAPPAHVAATASETPLPRKSIPVPITFVFNETTFTEDGRKAVALLLEYLQLKDFPRVSMTGHADERGTRNFNMELSRERLDAVAAYLENGGYKGELKLIPKGETEPFTGVDRSQYSGEELYQLDRRVELITSP
jgi:outer membrane protein OmpA-like peptidoglycan-associated protein